MDFLRNNLFYVILLAGVLVISVPSYILASSRQDRYKKALVAAEAAIRSVQADVSRLKGVTDESISEANAYRKQWEDQKDKVFEEVRLASKHLNYDFLVAPAKEGDTPAADAYRAAYNTAYDELIGRLVTLKLTDLKTQVLPAKVTFDEKTLPTPDQIRITQKQYWIVKALVDILADPACGIQGVTDVSLDFVPNSPNGTNGPDSTRTFWLYPVIIEVEMDFRSFPVLLQKLLANEDIIFYPLDYDLQRSFDDTKPVYTPTVTMTMYGQVYDYISTPWDTANLDKYKGPKGATKGPGAGTGKKAGK
jgi:hypothetical protein